MRLTFAALALAYALPLGAQSPRQAPTVRLPRAPALRALGLPATDFAASALGLALDQAGAAGYRPLDPAAAELRRVLSAYAAELASAVNAAEADPSSEAEPALARLGESLSAVARVARALPSAERARVLDARKRALEGHRRRRFMRARSLVTAADWGDLEKVSALADEIAPPVSLSYALDNMLANQASALRAGERSPVLGVLEKPIVRTAFLARRKGIERLRERLAGAPDAWAFLREVVTKGEPLKPRRRRLFEQLREYSPGLEPDRASEGHRALDLYLAGGGSAAGWAYNLAAPAGVGRAGYVAIQSWFGFISGTHTTLHEGFHQGDAGYARGLAAAQLLLGEDAGDALWRALIEGYTEHRTREAMRRMAVDGISGKGGPAGSLARRLHRRSRWPWNPKTVLENLEGVLSGHPYDPYVAAVGELLAAEGGPAAIEGLVSRGDWSGIVAVLGRERLDTLALVAAEAAADGGSISDSDVFPARRSVHVSGKLRLDAHLDARLADAVAGRLARAEAVRLVEAARALRAQADAALDLPAGRARRRAFSYLARARLDELLDVAASEPNLRERRERFLSELRAHSGESRLQSLGRAFWERRRTLALIAAALAVSTFGLMLAGADMAWFWAAGVTLTKAIGWWYFAFQALLAAAAARRPAIRMSSLLRYWD